MTVKLIREETSDQGTFGRIYFNNRTLFTGELPWRDNNNDVSCIPAGIYQCRFTLSKRFKRFLYLVEGVEGRTGIRIHPSNLMGDKLRGFHSQLNGCIALGKIRGFMQGQKAVLLSTTAVREFEKSLERKSFTLEIINGFS